MLSIRPRDWSVETGYGCIQWLEAGAGAPLVLLHSNGCSSYEFAGVIGPLAANRRVLVPDMPGHGDSGSITSHYTIGMYAEAIVVWLDALGIERAVFAGVSLGGTICLALGRDHAARVESIVLIETPLRSAAAWDAMWQRVQANFGVATQTAETIKPRFREVTPALLARWNLDRNKAGPETMIDVMRAIREFDSADALRALKVPATAILGEHGSVLDGRALLEKCLGPDHVVTMPDCGHFPMIDDPEGFVRALEHSLELALSR